MEKSDTEETDIEETIPEREYTRPGENTLSIRESAGISEPGTVEGLWLKTFLWHDRLRKSCNGFDAGLLDSVTDGRG